MAIRPIRLFGDPILLTEAEPVTDFDRSLRQLVKDLTETLRQAGGAGLAAPQIGVGLRVFAYSVNGERGYLVNPSLSFPDEQEQDGPEGCMSFPGLYYDVRRRQNTVARGFTAATRCRSSAAPRWRAACSTKPTISMPSCSSTGWTPPPGNSPCGRSARRRGMVLLPRRSASRRTRWAAARAERTSTP